MAVLVQVMVGSSNSLGGVVLTGFGEEASGGTLVEVARGGARAVAGGSTTPVAVLVGADGSMEVRAPENRDDAAAGVIDSMRQARLAERLVELGALATEHVGGPADIEWVWTPSSDVIDLLQLRPVAAPGSLGRAESDLSADELDDLVVEGTSVGLGRVAAGVLAPSTVDEGLELCNEARFRTGFVLAVHTTSPEWLPLIGLASAVVTAVGGRTSHAAIVCRELGIPAVVGCGEELWTVTGRHGSVLVVAAGDGLRGSVTAYDPR